MPDFDVGPGGQQPIQSSFRRLMNVGLGMMGVPIGLAIFAYVPSCMGFREPALDMVNQCATATRALGTPITQSYVGLSCGNAETEDDDGEASWSFPVAGPSGRGTLDLRGVERSGTWQLESLTLSTGGRDIDVIACAAGGTGEVVPITHRALTASVGAIVGEPGVAVGASCTVTIDPSDGPQNCRLNVTCGERTLYGGGSGGYGHCGVDASGALTMRDSNPSATDGDPMFDMRLGSSEIVITDQASSGTWVVTLAIAPSPA